MKRFIRLLATIGGVVVFALVSCAPRASTPPPTKLMPIVAPAPQPESSKAVSPEDVAWAKVVQAAKKEGKVNAYSYSWVGDIGLAISKAFKERYGISLEIVTGRGAEFAERVKTEKRMGQLVADMTEGSPLPINSMRLDGLLLSMARELPELRDKDVWSVDPMAMDPADKANLTPRISEYTAYINTKLVKPDEVPHSWKDLLDPKWKGKMSFSDPSTAGTYQYIVVLLDSKVWDEEYIRALNRQKLLFFPALTDEYLALARGDISLVVRGADSVAARYAMDGAPIQAIDLKEGAVLSAGTMAAIAGGPNPNATRVLLNWLFTTEGQTVFGKSMGNKMVRKGVPDFRPPAVQARLTNPLMMTVQHLDRATKLFQEKWFDKVVRQ